MEKVFLRKKIKIERIAGGHPWIYDNEIESVSKEPENGSCVEAWYGKTFLGVGYYNTNSIIRVRLLSRRNEKITKEFFEHKIKKAISFRRDILGYTDSYRVIFGEADGLPGLIVDKFSDYLSLQINTLGIYKWKQDILDILVSIFNPKGIFEKADEKSAQKEGFPFSEGWIYKTGSELIPFSVNGINFFADTLGQKTGFFLDQRLNALTTKAYSKDKTVLDAFSYTGNFGMHALAGNAKHVTFMDYSQRALDVVSETLKANKIDSARFELINCNSFDKLRQFDDEKKLFDFTIIDPPSMAKSRDSKGNAMKGYKELNLRAMKITKNGGLFSTSSCTQIVLDEDFKKVIYNAAEDTKKSLKLIYHGMQSPDHPDVLNILESEYLKHYLYVVENLKDF